MRQGDRRLFIFVARNAGFTGLLLISLVQVENQFVGRVAKWNELQMRLQREVRSGTERGDLVKHERRQLGVVECLHESPFDAGNIEGKAVTAARGLRIGGEPVGKL